MKKKQTETPWKIGWGMWVLLVLAILPRVVWLDVIPAGVNFDELDYLINAKAVYHGWTDLTGQWKPMSLTTLPDESPKGELPAVLLAPVVGPLPSLLFNFRLMFVLAGVAQVGLVYLIARKLFNERIGWWAGLVWALNPLAVFSSRLAFDGPLTATLYLAGWVLMLYAKKWWKLLAIVPYFLGFYSYIGTKLVLVPLVALIGIYSWLKIDNKKNGWVYLCLVTLAGLVLGQFVYRLPSLQSADRAGSMLTPNRSEVTQEVDRHRRLSLAAPSFMMAKVWTNRWGLFSKEVVDRALGGLAPSVLFSSGDAYHAFFLWHHGVFYYLDGVFLLVGMLFLAKKYRKQGWLILALIPILLLPAVLATSDLSYVYRSYLLYVVLAIVIGVGLGSVEWKKSWKSKSIGMGVLVGYVFLMGNFGYEYFFRNPVYHEGQFQLTFRVMARYVREESLSHDVVVLGTAPKQLFQQYLVYSGWLDAIENEEWRVELARRLRENDYYVGNVRFSNNVADCEVDEGKTLIVRDDFGCEMLKETGIGPDKALARISDSGQEFVIYNGEVCDEKKLGTYINKIGLDDLQIEQVGVEDFCQNFVVANK